MAGITNFMNRKKSVYVLEGSLKIRLCLLLKTSAYTVTLELIL